MTAPLCAHMVGQLHTRHLRLCSHIEGPLIITDPRLSALYLEVARSNTNCTTRHHHAQRPGDTQSCSGCASGFSRGALELAAFFV